MRKLTPQDFWAKVNKTAGCWLWTGRVFRSGYGMAWFSGRHQLAHRVSYQLQNGPIPAGNQRDDATCVLHRCDNPTCVNPSHLWLGSQSENVADRDSKGRQKTPHGEHHKLSKLTADQVIRIRSDSRLLRLVASDYGVSMNLICRIKKRQTWAHVP